MRRDDYPASPRFIAAYGRDVDIAEARLVYDTEGRRLTIEHGSRQDEKVTAALADIVDALSGSGTECLGERSSRRSATRTHPRRHREGVKPRRETKDADERERVEERQTLRLSVPKISRSVPS